MRKRYVKPSLPKDSWDLFLEKHRNINDDYRKLTGSNSKNPIPITKVFDAIAKKRIFFAETEIVRLGKGRWRRI